MTDGDSHCRDSAPPPPQPRRRLSGRLVIASHNPGKIVELREMLRPHNIETISAAELKLPEPEETGKTFQDNACIKAAAAAHASGLPALADDSGLEVEALDRAPGIYSARWAGPDKNFRHAMEMIERKLQERDANLPMRRMAWFVSALCVAWPDGHTEGFIGTVSGTITWPPRGKQGFGYDPIFLPDGQLRTFGEMSSEEKHALPPRGLGLSHRARAFLQLAEMCFERR